jgi:mRNA interferase RelE/StbE
VTKYRVEFTRRARKDIDKSPLWLTERVIELISDLEENPSLHASWDVRRLGGMEDLYRVRVGDYRIVYVVDERSRVISVLRATSRGDAYAD